MANLTSKDSDQEGWLRWANYHRTFFGWKSDSDGEMVASWVGFFRGEGYLPEEMITATKKIASLVPPPFQREHHLNHLANFLKLARAEESKIALRQNDELVNHPVPCRVCRNFGIVTVPHLKGVVRGEWMTNYTAGVYCNCYAGSKYSKSVNSKGESMTSLHAYERYNPLWEAQLDRRASREMKLNFLREDIRPPNNLDKILSKIQARVNRALQDGK